MKTVNQQLNILEKSIAANKIGIYEILKKIWEILENPEIKNQPLEAVSPVFLRIDNLISYLPVKRVDIHGILKMYPDQKMWETGDIKLMRDRYRETTKERKGRRRHTEPHIIESRLNDTQIQLGEAQEKLRQTEFSNRENENLKLENQRLRGKMKKVEDEMEKLRDENRLLRNRLKRIEQLVH